MDGFTLSIREEFREKDIRMINIYPGAVATDIWDDVPGEQDLSVMTVNAICSQQFAC